jgi:uncharacterized protein YkwD
VALFVFITVLLFSFLIKEKILDDHPKNISKTDLKSVLTIYTKPSPVKITPIITLMPTLTPIPAFTPQSTNLSQNSGEEDADKIFNSVNNFRQNTGLSTLSKNSGLCNVAKLRANELLSLGHLDNHDGWSKYAQSLTEFSSTGEVIEYTNFSADADYIVNSMWGKSASHSEIMSDPQWTDGCGGIIGGSSNYYGVFEFGKR